MQMFYCPQCDSIFSDPETVTTYESFDDSGRLDMMQYGACPYCGFGDFIEAERCEVCGEYFNPKEVDWSICDNCAEARYTTTRGIAAIQNLETEVSATHFFTPSQVEEILCRELTEAIRLVPRVGEEVREAVTKDPNWKEICRRDWDIEQLAKRAGTAK